ncbi:hypothetical protein A9G15_10095 [Gilliamella apis]|nr:hypothetical protein A9G15_10095 [Gilliamella apis]
MQFFKITYKINILNSFFLLLMFFNIFYFIKQKTRLFWRVFDIFKEKSTRPIINNSAGGANNT